MPCAATARGTKTTTSIPPFTGSGIAQPLPFNDAINNTPCGRRIISTANGVSFAASNLCLFHLQMLVGLKAVQPPYVDAA